MKPLEETKHDIANVLRQHGALLGYVFGSYGKGQTTPLSDVDVAVVFGDEVPRDNYFKRELAIASDIGKLLAVDRVDVVNLETVSSPVLRHRATLCGQAVLVTDETARFYLERAILQEYEDTQHLRAVQRSILGDQRFDGFLEKQSQEN